MKPMTKEEIDEFLKKAVTGRLGLSVDSQPYIVPLSFVYMDNKIYVHWFKEKGHKKAEMVKQNPNICFEIDEYSRDHLYRKSIIIDGLIKKVEDSELKKNFLKALAEKYPYFAEGGDHPRFVIPIIKKGLTLMSSLISVYEIIPEEVTGRKSIKKEKENTNEQKG